MREPCNPFCSTAATLPSDLQDEPFEQSIAEQLSEMAATCAALITENEQLTKLLTGGDLPMVGMVKEIKRLNAINAVLQERNDGLMNEKNEAIRAARKATR